MQPNSAIRFADGLGADLRHALRTLIANKGFTLAATLTLALGLGANTAIFSVVNAVLLKELPVKDPAELVIFYWLRQSNPMVAGYSGYGRRGPGGMGIRTSFSRLTFERVRDHNRTLSDVFALTTIGDLSVGADGQAESASADLVSGNYFATLGVSASLGRTLTPADDRPDAEPVAVISHRYWQRRFGGDPAVVGRALTLNRVPVVVVGVTAKTFEGMRIGEPTDLVVPITLAARLEGRPQARPISVWWVQIMGRLRPGVTREQALADIQAVFDGSVRDSWAARTSDASNQKGETFPQLRLTSGSRGPELPRRDAFPLLAGIFAVAGAVLLIGCVNVANLMLVRTLARRHEIAIRMALGASRRRVMQQVLAESLLIAIAGGVAGVAVAIWARNFLAWLPLHDAPIVEPRLEWPVLIFAGALSLSTAVVFGWGAARRAARHDLAATTRTSSARRRGLVRRGLVLAQVAITLLLLVGAGLFIQTLNHLNRVDVGFDPENLLVFRIDPGVVRDEARAFALLEDLVAGLEGVPGVRSATMSAMPVLAHGDWTTTVARDDGRRTGTAQIQSVRENFFDTMGIPILGGRGLSAADRGGVPRVAVINQTMARLVFDTPNPTGRWFQFVDGPDRGARVEIVGVVGDSAYARLQEPVPPTLFLSYRQRSPGAMTFEVRTAVEPSSLVPEIRKAAQRIDPALALSQVKSQRQQINETVALPRTLAMVTTACGVVGLLLAGLGLYGLVSFDVTQRTSEIGIRIALGARHADVIRLVLRELLGVVGLGVGAGLALAVLTATAAQRLFFGVAPADPLTMVVATFVLAVAALFAGYLPARRACRLDPGRALRTE